jgi:hypothetical protein
MSPKEKSRLDRISVIDRKGISPNLVWTAVWWMALGGSLWAAPINLVPGHKQLFLDDYVAQQMSGLARTMHQPTRMGAPVRPDVPSDGYLVQIRSVPMWVPEEGVFRLIHLVDGSDLLLLAGHWLECSDVTCN